MSLQELITLRVLLKKFLKLVEKQDQMRTDVENVIEEVHLILAHAESK